MYVMTFGDSSLAPVLPEDAAPLVAENGGGKVCHGSGGIVPQLAE